MRLVLLSLAFAAATLVFGWWSTPLLGLAWGFLGRGTSRPALAAGLAASTGWVLLLGWSAALGPVPLLAGKLGAIAGMPGMVFVALTVLLPFLLAFAAARVTRR